MENAGPNNDSKIIALSIDELRQNLINVINKSCLDVSVVELVVKDIYNQVLITKLTSTMGIIAETSPVAKTETIPLTQEKENGNDTDKC